MAHSHAHAHDHAHHHGHGHGHSHAPASFGRAFAIGITLNIGFVAAEAVFGALSGSLALLADAGHNLSDVLGLLLAWVATVLVKRKPTARRTYGLRRSSILAALFNAVLLLVAVAGIAWEAVGRFANPAPVATQTVVIVASIGIVINGVTAWLFASGAHDLNLRGAFLHMAGDALVSAGVVVAALLMSVTGYLWIDPTVSLAIALFIALSTWRLLRESLDLALDAVPPDIDAPAVERYLRALPGVVAVHDLHIWAMSTTQTALTVHLVKPDATLDDALLSRIRRELHDEHGIEHVTVQLERGDLGDGCALSDACCS